MGHAIHWESIATPDFKTPRAGAPDCWLLSNSGIPTGDPEIEGQIGQAESDHIIEFFKTVYAPAIVQAGIELETARILELGAGFGRLSYGTLMNITPEIYVATDVFPDLVRQLTRNLEKWSSSRTTIGAGILDPSDNILFKKGVFNIIQSHSVLHHVLDYKHAVRALYDKLDTPGILIFGEPSVDGYLVLVMLIRSIKMASTAFSEPLVNSLSTLEDNLLGRIENRENLDYLRRFGHGDKHIFSVYDFMDLAADIGARLHIQREYRGLRGVTIGQLAIRNANDQDRKQITELVTTLLPLGTEHALFNDLRTIFCLIKEGSPPIRYPSGETFD